MRAAVALLLLAAAPAWPQVRDGESAEILDAREKLLYIYRRADVAAACERNPAGTLTLTLTQPPLPPREFQIDCRVRAAYLEQYAER